MRKKRELSPEFINVWKNDAPKPGEMMPCPRCGGTKITYRTKVTMLVGAAVLVAISFLAGEGELLWLRVVAAGAAFFFGFIGLFAKPVYQCRRCRFMWSYESAEEWVRQEASGEASGK